MITVNNKSYKNNPVTVTFGDYNISQNGKRRSGRAPFISFKCNNLYIGIELIYDEKWIIELKENNKKDISKFVSDITYEDEKGWISLNHGKYNCYLEKINNHEYKIELNCCAKEEEEMYIININEVIIIASNK